ncbi:MAG: retroviral-like aspartic protease family protein [Rubrivivax sp.]|nr:retroviral-like aspartic protease family protein [Rubrivivax sp.]
MTRPCVTPLVQAARLAAGLLLAGTTLAQAQGIVLAGRMGDRALLVIDGKPHTLAIGAAVAGVRLLRWNGDEAELDYKGSGLRLSIGTPAQLAGGSSPVAAAREIVIPASGGGHFMASGSINGKSAQFMVDTGATLVAVGKADAERLGLDLSAARQGITQTANGAATVQIIVLPRLRVGNVEVTNVGAAVLPTSMPYVLLGNSFLSRFQMRRDNDVMRLELR